MTTRRLNFYQWLAENRDLEFQNCPGCDGHGIGSGLFMGYVCGECHGTGKFTEAMLRNVYDKQVILENKRRSEFEAREKER